MEETSELLGGELLFSELIQMERLMGMKIFLLEVVDGVFGTKAERRRLRWLSAIKEARTAKEGPNLTDFVELA